MFIAFEGPDNVGKSTSALELSASGQPDYNATKLLHARNQAEQAEQLEVGLPHTYDRIDWLSHMVYRLALPDRDWNDDRPRTVFAMPDTHLVFKLHAPELADFTAEEVVNTPILEVNRTYDWLAWSLIWRNEAMDYRLFKTISIMEVRNEEGSYSQHLMHFYSPVDSSYAWANVDSNDKLLEMLYDNDRQRL